MAVMYSKLGGCLGDTTKLGPLARTDLCAQVKGLMDKLITHLGLGSSKEDPWGAYWGEGVPSWEPALLAWGVALFPWEAWEALSLAECLTACLPACLLGAIACLGRTFPRWRGGASFLGSSTVLRRVGTCLPGKKLNWFLPGKYFTGKEGS